MELTAEQSRAAKAIREWLEGDDRVYSLTGLAGTGKTTVIGRILGEEIKAETPVLALTGKATLALRKKGVGHASTIHSAIYRAIESATGTRWVKRSDLGDERRPLAIIDEASMINAQHLSDLLEVFDRLLLVGDHGQLPPIDGEGVLAKVAGWRLSTVLRQALDSGILRAAHELRNGASLSRAIAQGGSDVLARAPIEGEIAGGATWPLDEATLITARNADRVWLNLEARKGAGLSGQALEVGDRIVALSNTPSGWVNGMVADLVWVGEPFGEDHLGEEFTPVRAICDDGAERSAELLTAQLDSPKVRDDICRKLYYEHRTIRHSLFARGWCLTGHKAQGSEWPKVIVYGDGFGRPDDRAAWRYTVATRASGKLFWLGV